MIKLLCKKTRRLFCSFVLLESLKKHIQRYVMLYKDYVKHKDYLYRSKCIKALTWYCEIKSQYDEIIRKALNEKVSAER